MSPDGSNEQPKSCSGRRDPAVIHGCPVLEGISISLPLYLPYGGKSWGNKCLLLQDPGSLLLFYFIKTHFVFYFLFIFIFIFGCVGSSLLRAGFL